MKLLFSILIVVALFFPSDAIAQNPWDVEWTRTYGGGLNDYAYSVQQTSDGGYIIAGCTASFGAGDYDFYLVKTDASGNQLWAQTYGGTGYELSYSVQQTSDGGYIVVGYTNSFGVGDYDFYLVKTDGSGNEQWTQTYGGSGPDLARSVQQTSDGGYIIAGYTVSFGAGSWDFYVVKTDGSGNEQWAQTYGGTGPDQAWSVQETSDGGYIIAGEEWSFGNYYYEFYVVKTDGSGNIQWTRSYGGPHTSGRETARSVQETSDGGYIIGGRTSSFPPYGYDFYLVKTDDAGNELWAQRYGGINWDDALAVDQTSDGGYVIAGYTDSFGAGKWDFYVVKTDAAGNELWAQTYGGAREDLAWSVQQTSDGGYIIAGEAWSFGAGGRDFYLVKTVGSVIPNLPPTADAGDDQSVHVGVLATLDGSGSSDPDGNYPLSFSWTLVNTPPGSGAMLQDAETVNPSFTPDLVGDYVAELVVTDDMELEGLPDAVLVSTYNTPPVAEAGDDQEVIEIGSVIQLDGSQSWDDDGDEPLDFVWTITQKPEGSLAELDNPASPTPTFVADLHGDYMVSLTVSDPWSMSDPDMVTISFENVVPVADAGVNQAVLVWETAFLDGSGSSDANGDLLTYQWSIVSQPEGSMVAIDDPLAESTSFVPDEPGDYVVSLVVNDGFVNSLPSNISVIVMSYPEAIELELKQSIDFVNTLPDAAFKNDNGDFREKFTGNGKLGGVLNQVIGGDYSGAYNKLASDVLGKTDGCALTGAPEKDDWIDQCWAQEMIFPLILEALLLLQNMM